MPTISRASNSSMKSHSLSLDLSSLMEERIMRNISAVPREASATWFNCTSEILVTSSAVGSIVFRIFCNVPCTMRFQFKKNNITISIVIIIKRMII